MDELEKAVTEMQSAANQAAARFWAARSLMADGHDAGQLLLQAGGQVYETMRAAGAVLLQIGGDAGPPE